MEKLLEMRRERVEDMQQKVHGQMQTRDVAVRGRWLEPEVTRVRVYISFNIW